MSEPLSKRLRMPSGVALLLGLSALSAAGARADVAREQPTGPGPRSQAERMSPDGGVLRSDAGRLYLSENGGQPQELRLGDTPEARRLRQLLQQHSAASGVRLDLTLLAGGGGEGISWSHWKPVGSSPTEDPAKTSSARRAALPNSAHAPRHTGASEKTNVTSSENKK
ncbi:MAG: hypothetical protein JO204_12630 [Alphaproteobacteria bacterium]|nr:hypothetical protein [Alphaproteobacteria bacterium]